VEKHPFQLDASNPVAVGRALCDHGIALLPGWLRDPNRCSTLAREAEQFLDWRPCYAQVLGSYPDGNGIRVERERAATDAPGLHALFDQSWMRQVAASFFGSQPYVFNHDLMIVRDMVGTQHLAHQVHYDRMPQLKYFLYLTDTTVANGAFHCLPGSHRRAKEAQRANRAALRLPASLETRVPPAELDGELVPVEGESGTLLVFDSDIAHRGAPLSKGHRLSVRSRSYHPAYLTRWAP
jgi:hypothetical protein